MLPSRWHCRVLVAMVARGPVAVAPVAMAETVREGPVVVAPVSMAEAVQAMRKEEEMMD